MAIFSMINGSRQLKTIHVSKDLDPKSWTGRDRQVLQSDFDVIENMSVSDFDKWFETYHNWCWGHGYGNCDTCRKYYRELRLAKIMNDKYKSQTGKNIWE